MSISHTLRFYGSLAELEKCGALKEHAHLLCRAIRISFDGAFEDEPEEYKKMEDDIRISVELTHEDPEAVYQPISVDAHWGYKEMHGSFKYDYGFFRDDDDDIDREYDALLVTYNEEFHTVLHISPVTICVVNKKATIRNLLTSSLHTIDLSNFTGIRAY